MLCVHIRSINQGCFTENISNENTGSFYSYTGPMSSSLVCMIFEENSNIFYSAFAVLTAWSNQTQI